MELKNIFTRQPNTSSAPLPVLEFMESADLTFGIVNQISRIEEDYFNVMHENMQITHMMNREYNDDIITEGFKDIVNNIVEFFKSLIERIKEFTKTSFMYLQSFFGDFEKFLNKYKDVLLKKDYKFTIRGFNYTFPNNVPNIDDMNRIVNSYNSELNRISNMTQMDLTNMRQEVMNEENKALLRGRVIGENRPIKGEDFSVKLNAKFRNGAALPIENIQVNTAYVSKIINNYGQMKSLLSSTVKERDKIVNSLIMMKRFFENKAVVYYDNQVKQINTHTLSDKDNNVVRNERVKIEYSTDMIRLMNTFFDIKFNETKMLSTYATRAYFEKVKAIKECMSQYKKVIRKCITVDPDDESSFDATNDDALRNDVLHSEPESVSYDDGGDIR